MIKSRIGLFGAVLFAGLFFVGLYLRAYIERHSYLGIIFPGSMLMMIFCLGYGLGGKVRSGLVAVGIVIGIFVLVLGLSKLGISAPGLFFPLFLVAMFWYFKIGKKKNTQTASADSRTTQSPRE